LSLNCKNARTLIPSYLDGEVSEAQAAPLRRHLLSCPACRELAKSETALQRWFAPPAAHQARPGFSARVAQAAFHADEVHEEEGATLLPHPSVPARAALPDSGSAAGLALVDAGVALEERPTQQFVLLLTAAAAAVLLLFAVALQRNDLPSRSGLDATPDLSTLFEQIEAENAQVSESPADLSPAGEAEHDD